MSEGTQPQAAGISGLAVGRIVWFESTQGDVRPAIVTRVWDRQTGCSDLVVFGLPERSEAAFPRTSVLMGTGENTWRWPDRAD